MADLSDVLVALGNLANAALYPAGQPTGAVQVSPVAGVPVRIMDGWPTPAALDELKASNLVVVSIYPQQIERNTTRYPREWLQTSDPQAHTVTLTQAGQTVVVGGAQPAPFYSQNLAVFINGKPYLYQTRSSDSLANIAAALAALIAVSVPGTTSSGSVIALPNTARVGALRVGTTAAIAMEVKRQERHFSLIIWAPKPTLRDAVAAPIDVAVGMTPWLTLKDGSRGRLIYRSSPFTDFDQLRGLFRRDLIVTVEYPTIATDAAPEVIAAKTIIDQVGADGSLIAAIATQYN